MKKVYIICESDKNVSYLNDIWEVFTNRKIASQRVKYLKKTYKDSNFWIEEKRIQNTWIWKETLYEYLEPAE